MSSQIDYFKGEPCGIGNCKSKRFFVADDGETYCGRGHMQEVNFTQTSYFAKVSNLLSRVLGLRSRMRMTLGPKGAKVVERKKFRRRFPEVISLALAIFVSFSDLSKCPVVSARSSFISSRIS